MKNIMEKFEELVFSSIYFLISLGVLYIVKHFCGWENTVLFALASIMADLNSK